MAIETFKILHKLTPVYLQYQVSYKNSVYSFRYENLVEVSRVGTTNLANPHFTTRQPEYGTASQTKLRTVEDLGEFRRFVQTWSGT